MLVYVVLNLFSNILEQILIQFSVQKKNLFSDLIWANYSRYLLELMLKEVCCHDFNFSNLRLTFTRKKCTPKVGNPLANLTYFCLASISDAPCIALCS